LAALNATDVAFIDYTLKELRTYQMGSQMNVLRQRP